MSRRCANNNSTLNNGSVFTTGGGSTTEPPVVMPSYDGEPLCEICALVDGVAMWVIPFICVDTETKESTTIYLDSLGQEITGVVEAVDPKNCINCESDNCISEPDQTAVEQAMIELTEMLNNKSDTEGK